MAVAGNPSKGRDFWERTPAIAMGIAAVLLIAGVLVALYGDRSYKTQKTDEVSVQAQILGSTVTAALVFMDRDAAREYVTALKANPEIQVAAVYDAQGALFASYAR